MKVKVNNKKDFEPIELTITIESKEELEEMYARFNITNVALNENSCGYNAITISHEEKTYEVYNALRKICKRL